MLPTFVIGLREGVEASLIVGIVAAFLRQQGRRDALRWMWAGVSRRGHALHRRRGRAAVLDRRAAAAPAGGARDRRRARSRSAMVTFMIVWMRRHARGLAGELRASAAERARRGSAWALVAMAFFAVLREGLETAVFLLAAFQASGDATSAGRRRGARRRCSRSASAGGSTAAACASTSAASSGSPARARARRRRARHVGASTPRTRRLAEQPAGAARSTSAGSCGPGRCSSSLLTGVLGLQPRRPSARRWLAALRGPDARVTSCGPTGGARSRRRRGRRVRPTAIDVSRRSSPHRSALAAVAVARCALWRRAAARPAAAPRPRRVTVTLTDAGCSPAKLTAQAGPVTFKVANGGTSKVTELELKNAERDHPRRARERRRRDRAARSRSTCSPGATC